MARIIAGDDDGEPATAQFEDGTKWQMIQDGVVLLSNIEWKQHNQMAEAAKQKEVTQQDNKRKRDEAQKIKEAKQKTASEETKRKPEKKVVGKNL